MKNKNNRKQSRSKKMVVDLRKQKLEVVTLFSVRWRFSKISEENINKTYM